MIKGGYLRFRQTGGLLCSLLLGGIGVGCLLPAQHARAQAQSAISMLPPSPVTAYTAPAVDQSAAPAGVQGYLIGPGDQLAINVWKDAELSRTMPVRPDGRISLPLIGEIQAAGLTAPKLQEVILQRLSMYMSDPQVNVIVQEIKSRSFNVVGKVNRPGAYDLTRPMTVLDAVALSGGLREFARGTKMYVLRRVDDGTTRRLPFNYKQVIKGKAINQNVQLQPGDTVVAP